MRLKCKVVLSGGFSAAAYSAEGEIDVQQNGFGLFYKYDGDDCFIGRRDGETVYRRSGEVKLEMKFVAGKKTSAVLSADGREGSFSIRCTKSELIRFKDGFGITLCYDAGAEIETMKIKVIL